MSILARRRFLVNAARIAAAGFFVPATIVRAVEKGKEFKTPDELFDAYTSGGVVGYQNKGHNIVGGDFGTPDDLVKAYSDGAEGAVFEPGRLDAVLAKLKHGRFCEAAPGLVGSGNGRVSLPFKNVLYFDPLFYNEFQTTLDCTSFGTRGALQGTACFEIKELFEAETFPARFATEGIYGARGYSGGGMDPARAAQWVHEEGGILLRKDYGIVDLTTYNGSVGRSWGARGIPAEIVRAAAEHRVDGIAPITTVAEARDAIANGYFIAIGSGYGFTRTRDKNGFCRRSKGWNHCMHWIGCDDFNYGECAFVDANSWGDYLEGGHPVWGELPTSCFLIHEEDAAGMIAQRGAWAYSLVNGWPAREIKEFGANDFAWRVVRLMFNAIG